MLEGVGLGGGLTHHSQWMWQLSVDLLTQTPLLMNQTWFLSVRRTPSQRLDALQNKAQLHQYFNILFISMLTLLNTIFVSETLKEEYWEG